VFEVSKGILEGTISDEDQKKFKEANTPPFTGCIMSVLANCLCDVYMHIRDGKELWDTLNAKFGATKAGNEPSLQQDRALATRSCVTTCPKQCYYAM
jgi:hypothetical protein